MENQLDIGATSHADVQTSPNQRVLQSWLDGLRGVDQYKIAPRVLDETGKYRSVDALILTRGGRLILVDAWWPSRPPRRNPRTGALEVVFDGIPVTAPDPAIRLNVVSGLLVRAGGQKPLPLDRVILAPTIQSADRGECEKVWAESGLRLRVGSWPEEVDPTAVDAEARTLTNEIFRRLVRDPHETLASARFRRDLGQLISSVCGLMRAVDNIRAADNCETRWHEIDSQPVRVALLGTFSSGKSTLVNILTAPHFFPVSDVPTTAQRVEIRHGTGFRARIRYRTAAQIQTIRKLAERRRAKLPRGLSVEDLDPADGRLGTSVACAQWEQLEALIQDSRESVFIESLHVELPVAALQSHVIVDLPGTDSDIPWHREVTRAALEDVDAAIYLFRAGQPFGEKDRDLLHEASMRMNLSDTTRFLFLANMIDRVRTPSERAAVVARVDGLLQYHFGIERPLLLPTCLLLEIAPLAMASGRMSAESRQGLNDDLEDARSSMGVNPTDTAADVSRHSGIHAIHGFLLSVAAERRLWKTRAALDSVAALLRDAERSAEMERDALAATSERVRQAQSALLQATVTQRKQLKVEVDKARVELVRRIETTCGPQPLVQRWSDAIDRFVGDKGKLDRDLKQSTVEVLKKAASDVQSDLEKFQIKQASVAQALVQELVQAIREFLEVKNVQIESENRDIALLGTEAHLAVNWERVQVVAEAGIADFSFGLAGELFTTAGSFELGKGIWSDLGSGALALASAAAGVVAAVVGGIATAVGGFFDWLFGSPRDPHEAQRQSVRDQLSEQRARDTMAPLAQKARSHCDDICGGILRAFDAKTTQIHENLSAGLRNTGEDVASVEKRLKKVEKTVRDSRALQSRILVAMTEL